MYLIFFLLYVYIYIYGFIFRNFETLLFSFVGKAYSIMGGRLVPMPLVVGKVPGGTIIINNKCGRFSRYNICLFLSTNPQNLYHSFFFGGFIAILFF